jgi:hypothetical protein
LGPSCEDHERLNEIYFEITGQLSPVKNNGVSPIDTPIHHIARQEIAEVAGHSRESIAGAYLGK